MNPREYIDMLITRDALQSKLDNMSGDIITDKQKLEEQIEEINKKLDDNNEYIQENPELKKLKILSE
jgi:peptidoglycan hydrolase CwlO-like protein